MNEDGVIDMSEFSRWYFTGMKSYADNKKKLLKLGKHSKSIFNKLAAKSKEDLGKEIKMKNNKILLGFNRPANPKTQISMKFNLCGSYYNEQKTHMNQYEGLFNREGLRGSMARILDESAPLMKIEIWMTAPYNPQKHLDNLQYEFNQFAAYSELGTEAIKPKFLY